MKPAKSTKTTNIPSKTHKSPINPKVTGNTLKVYATDDQEVFAAMNSQAIRANPADLKKIRSSSHDGKVPMGLAKRKPVLSKANAPAKPALKNHFPPSQPLQKNTFVVLTPARLKMDCIIPPTDGIGGIFLGNIEGAKDIRNLKKNQINSVLTVAAATGIRYMSGDIPHHKIILANDIETYPLNKHFKEATEFLDDQLKIGNVFVHCFAGVSRSATIVIMYLMQRKEWPLEKAFQFVREKRMIIGPNPGFMRQLRNFEAKLVKERKEKGMKEQKDPEMKS